APMPPDPVASARRSPASLHPRGALPMPPDPVASARRSLASLPWRARPPRRDLTLLRQTRKAFWVGEWVALRIAVPAALAESVANFLLERGASGVLTDD